MYFQFPKIIRKLFMFASGMAIGKEKDGIFDHDVRPIIITNSLIRLVDKVIMACHREERKELIGPYQLIGQKAALEKGMVITTQMQRLQKYDGNLVCFNADAKNAYNSVSRNEIHRIVSGKSKRLANWFSFLYQDTNLIRLDHMTTVKMNSGVFQGLASSEMFYLQNLRILKSIEKCKIMIQISRFIVKKIMLMMVIHYFIGIIWIYG